MAFATECNLDAQGPQERLRATQAASEHAGIFGPAGTVLQNPVTAAISAGSQEVGGAACPRAALGHDLPMITALLFDPASIPGLMQDLNDLLFGLWRLVRRSPMTLLGRAG
jgi:hypothetical protein